METNRNSCRILAALVLTAGFAAFAKDTGNAYVQPREGHFERMMFNNPGLEVDLSLGIWPHVAVYDYNKDGKNDVVIRAAAVPINGSKRNTMCRVYLNPTQDHAGLDIPVADFRISDGKRHPDATGVSCPHPRKPNGLRANFVDLDTDGVEDLVYTLSDWTKYGKVPRAASSAIEPLGITETSHFG